MTVETQPAQQSPPQAPTPEPPRRSRSLLRTRRGVIGIAAVLAAVVVAAFVLLGDDESGDKGGTITGSPESAFRITYPPSWRPLSKEELEALPAQPMAVLRREDGKGFVVIRREKGRPVRNFTQLKRDLTRELKERVPDFKQRSGKTVQIRAGTAFFASYIRKRTGTVHSIVVVPAGSKMFTLNTVSRGGADDVAREIGRMIVSFDA
jgi:hypothetical protein